MATPYYYCCFYCCLPAVATMGQLRVSSFKLLPCLSVLMKFSCLSEKSFGAQLSRENPVAATKRRQLAALLARKLQLPHHQIRICNPHEEAFASERWKVAGTLSLTHSPPGMVMKLPSEWQMRYVCYCFYIYIFFLTLRAKLLRPKYSGR